MLLIFFLAFWIPLVGAADHADLPAESIQIHRDTEFVIFGTRHGNRNPEKFLTGIDRQWGNEGVMELTSIGKRQAYGFGVEFRKFIKNLTPNNFNTSQVKYYSSSANRCQSTLQVATTGIHPPEEWADWNVAKFDNWSPIPYIIDDQMLRMYSVKGCARSDDVWAPIDKDLLPDLEKLKTQDAQVLQYASQMTGWNMTQNLGVAADLADNIMQMDFYNTTYPTWMTSPTLTGYNSTSLKSKIMEFAEIHPRSCAYYEPCRSLMAGYWLNDILEKLETAKSGTPLKVVGYSSHTEITLSVMKLLGIQKDEVTTSAGFVIEYKSRPNPSIRLLNHDPNPIDQHVIYMSDLEDSLTSAKDVDGFIDLQYFLNYAKPKSYQNWKSECGIKGCDPNGNQ